MELAVAELEPEVAILRGARVIVIAKQAVVLADDLIEAVADHIEKVAVGGEHGAPQVEFDDRLGAVDGRHLALELGVGALGLDDVGGELDDLERPAVDVEDRVVGGLDPDLASVLAEPLVLAGVKSAGAELAPELRYSSERT